MFEADSKNGNIRKWKRRKAQTVMRCETRDYGKVNWTLLDCVTFGNMSWYTDVLLRQIFLFLVRYFYRHTIRVNHD